MPKEVYGRDHRFLDRRELLTFEEIARVARTFVSLGTRKLRITGGEPLVRRDLERLIASSPSRGSRLTLTTNGVTARGEGAGARRRRASIASPSASTRSTTRRSGP